MDIEGIDRLFKRYLSCFEGVDRNQVRDSFVKLVGLYEAPNRHYHRLEHLRAMLEFMDVHVGDRDVVLDLATFFHDAIYKTTSGNNEKESAELAQKHLKALRFDEEQTLSVCALIEATAGHHAEAGNWRSSMFLDADLSVLGSTPERYQRYSEAIRREYQWVPGFMYRKARKKILGNFLEREQLYFCDPVYDRLEAIARENLSEEMKRL